MTTLATRNFETDTPPNRRPCGCVYCQISVMNTRTIGGTTFVLKWIRTVPCAQHPEQTSQDA
jgi:hypothetical protein